MEGWKTVRVGNLQENEMVARTKHMFCERMKAEIRKYMCTCGSLDCNFRNEALDRLLDSAERIKNAKD